VQPSTVAALQAAQQQLDTTVSGFQSGLNPAPPPPPPSS